ncbi:GntR family transcriptional regulator [Niallia taxi]|uniref:GntR family transcriptional regulator n=1 Tax=Niallia taxi TaxID=2499688 RepID=UPI003981DEC4
MLLQTQQLPNEIFNYMVNQIINGELPQGSRIRESDYAEKFSVSRSPVREALYRLEQEGIAVKKPRKGSFVKEFSTQDVYDIFEIRNNLEQMAIRRLNQVDISDYSFNSLQEELKQMKNVKNQVDYTLMNFNFHYHMISLSNSDVLQEFYLKLKYPLLMFQNLNFTFENRINLSISEHEKMLDLIQQGKFDELQDILLTHNNRVLTNLKDYLKKQS